MKSMSWGMAWLFVAVPLIAQTPGVADARLEVLVGGTAKVFTRSDLGSMPRQEVRATAHGETHSFSGVSIADVLRRAGVAIDSVRGPRVADYVVVAAADGYRAVFSLGELAPDLSGRVILVADSKDGSPLDAKDGPFRLVVPDERRPTRWVRQVTTLTIHRAAP
jgi:hypothetical protein